jgi:hypothetical protein
LRDGLRAFGKVIVDDHRGSAVPGEVPGDLLAHTLSGACHQRHLAFETE